MDKDIKANIMTISRHRFNSDGNGVTTLVTFYGCPLKCKYCINDFCHEQHSNMKTVDEVLDELMKDDIYYRATNGGITFGGGEPLLNAEFIAELCSKMPKEWSVNVETSLAVPYEKMEMLIPYVNHWYVDTKDFYDEGLYDEYTQTKGRYPMMRKNLLMLLKICGSDMITVRVPIIKGFNNETDVRYSEILLKQKGFENIDKFEYKIE